MRSALITGAAALAGLALVLLATMIIARSMVRPLRRLEAAALDVAGARLVAGTGGGRGSPPAAQRHLRPLLPAQPLPAGTAAAADRQLGTHRGRPGTAGQPVPDGSPGHPDAAQLRQRARPRGPRDITPPGRAGHPGGRAPGGGVRDRGVRPGRPGRPARCLGQRERRGRHRAPAGRAAGERHRVLAQTTQVIVSGHTVRDGGSLITITDARDGHAPRNNWGSSTGSWPTHAARTWRSAGAWACSRSRTWRRGTASR